ncbi:uncharacterized protein LOC114528832 [Dendronephthya gigantea]|uniref:uncharacterized protein LOC114528832 n=1 Tax=Dendronephthya gigantea TaxID=151771 RepID=UPI001069460A|nr:uncharacterized protein LOC114528832 [Dendronephthya gigantea]
MEDDSMDITLSSSRSSSRAVSHVRCGSRIMWRRTRMINSMILNEDIQVTPIATKESAILQTRSFTREEITFPNIDIVDVPSLESNILALPRNDTALTKPCLHDCKPTKYVIQSFISSLDHFVEFEEESALKQEKDIPLRINSDSGNSQLQDGRFKNEIAVKKNETEFDCQDETSSIPPSISRDLTEGNAPKNTSISQVVPDMHPPEQTMTRSKTNSSHIVPSLAEDIMDTTDEESLHDFPSQTHKPLERKPFEETGGCNQLSKCSTMKMEIRRGENIADSEQSSCKQQT